MPPRFWTGWTAVDSPKILDVFKGLVAVATHVCKVYAQNGAMASFPTSGRATFCVFAWFNEGVQLG